MPKIPTKETIKRRTIEDMKKLGVYKPQYNRLIDIYSELVFQFLTLNDEFERGGYRFEVETGLGGKKKAPIVATLENLRKDILAYSNQLCLNPKALENVTAENPKISRLEKALRELG